MDQTSFRKMTVAITGELPQPRSYYAAAIDSLENTRFVTKVAGDTDYLVAVRFDTAKAKKAAISGTTIISESDLTSFIAIGSFPWRNHRETHIGNWPDINWTRTIESPTTHFLKYRDREGAISFRYVVVTRYGHDQHGNEYAEAFDGLDLKTFRLDRIISLDKL